MLKLVRDNDRVIIVRSRSIGQKLVGITAGWLFGCHGYVSCTESTYKQFKHGSTYEPPWLLTGLGEQWPIS